MSTNAIIKSHKEIESFNWLTNFKYRLKTAYSVLTEKRFIYIGVDDRLTNLDIHIYKLNNRGTSKILSSAKGIYDERIEFGKCVDETLNKILNGNS
jgi:hypothetical protein